MKSYWFLLAGSAALVMNPSGQGAIDQQIRTQVRSEPNMIAGPPRSSGSAAANNQGVLIETSSNLGIGIGAEL